MKQPPTADERIARLVFAEVYPLLLAKVARKGRTRAELHRVIAWLCGFDDAALASLIAERVTYAEFFRRARLHPNADLITGTICGHRIAAIADPLTRQVRQLDKLVDELARGRPMEKILRARRPDPTPGSA